MFHAREVESSLFDGPETRDRDEGAGRPAGDGLAPGHAPDSVPSSSSAGEPPASVVGPTTRKRSETYVARRSWAVLVLGLKSLLLRAYEARWTLRVISVTAAAAGATWAVCLPFGGFAPAFGAASAVYAVQLTVRTSVLDGAKRTVLMGLSVFLAVVILRIVGLSALAVIALVFVSLAAGQLLRLGASGSLQIPGTAIFILALGTSVSTTTLLDRVWATLVGAVVGAAASYVAYPGDPRSRARRALAGLAGSIADLLSDISAGVARTPAATETDVWLARSRALEEELEHARPLVDEAVAFLRVDPFGRKTASAELSHALVALTHSGGPAACDSAYVVRPPDRRGAAAARQPGRGALPHRCRLPRPGRGSAGRRPQRRCRTGRRPASPRRIASQSPEGGRDRCVGCLRCDSHRGRPDGRTARRRRSGPGCPERAPPRAPSPWKIARWPLRARLTGMPTRENLESLRYPAGSSSRVTADRPYRNQIGGFLETRITSGMEITPLHQG